MRKGITKPENLSAWALMLYDAVSEWRRLEQAFGFVPHCERCPPSSSTWVIAVQNSNYAEAPAF